MSDVNQMGHPPGYPIILAAIFRIFGDSNDVIQLLQIALDSLAPVLLFLIAFELTSFAVSLIAALLAALSPQFAYFSVLLLPDSLAVLPLLLAFYFILLGRRRKQLIHFGIAGGLIGASCWLRANALLLAPFLALLTPLFIVPGKRLRASILLLLGSTLLIVPITIKNAFVHHRFVPLSLGAGQTLLEGLSDYDPNGTLNIPNTDLGLQRQEAQWYSKPEYALSLFGEDGIDRERVRIARGLSVIRAHPVWFASVVGRRAIASTRLDPVPRLSAETHVSHDYENPPQEVLKWWSSAAQLAAKGSVGTGVSTSLLNNDWIRVSGNDSRYGDQFKSEPISVEPDRDYVLRFPFTLETGRVTIGLATTAENRTLSVATVDLVEGKPPQEQPEATMTLPFVSANTRQVQLVVSNNASSNATLKLGKAELFDLGPATNTWLRYVRMPLGFVQRLFVTAWILPLAIIGLIRLCFLRKFQTIALLLMVPAYYLVVQSALHTERRYIYVIHFFFLIFVSVALVSSWKWITSVLARVPRMKT